MSPTPPDLPESAMPPRPHEKNATIDIPTSSQAIYHTTPVRSFIIAAPTVLVRAPTPEASLASSLPTAFDLPLEPARAHSSGLDVAPSEGSGSSSFNSDPPTPGSRNFASISDSLFIEYGSDGALKSATLRGLVERLILDSGNFREDMQFRDTFLTSYRAFSNAEEVFGLLLDRFEAASSPQYTGQQRASMRYSVLIVLELWLRGNHAEVKDTPLLQSMGRFAASIQASSSASSFSREAAQRLIQMIERKSLPPVPPLTPSSSHSSLKLYFKPSEISPQVLALVLTSIEGSRYQNIIDSECIGWLEGIGDSNEISSFISENKKLSYWAQKSILRPDEQSQRAENLKYFLSLVEECRKLRNFSSACALIGGLATSSITGLKRTCGALDRSSASVLMEAEKLVSFHMNFKAYRAALNESKEPCIPWLYVHLHDLKIIHRAHSRYVDAGGHKDLINFHKYRRVHDRIRHILSYQALPLKPENGARYAQIQNFVESKLRSLVIDDALRGWLEERGSKLAQDEKTDYDGFGSELVDAGFIKRGAVESPPRSSGVSSYTSRPILRPRVTPASAHQDVSAPLSPETPIAAVHGQPNIGTPAEQTYQIPEENSFDLDPSQQGTDTHLDNNYENVFNKHSIRCLDSRITLTSPHPVAGGGFADVREGLLVNQKVAIKTIRPFSSTGKRLEESRLLRRLWREYSAWTKVSHPIVLQCLGFSYDFSPPPYVVPSLISPWMSNGTARTYLENYPDKDRLELLVAVAEGLAYLHDQESAIIHGDLRGANILISDSGRPCLSDFGLARILKLEGMTPTSEHAGSLRWMSPELLRDEFPSASSDVWAYGMTVLELISGNHPYHKIVNDVLVFGEIKDGQIPSRPQATKFSNGLSEDVWAICQQCWLIVPSQRPSMREVFNKINRLNQ